MENGNILIDSHTGLKLLVVNPPTQNIEPEDIVVNGNPLVKETATPAGSVIKGMKFVTDPGERS